MLLSRNNQFSQAQVASICASFVRNALLHASITCKNLLKSDDEVHWYKSKSIGQVQVDLEGLCSPFSPKSTHTVWAILLKGRMTSGLQQLNAEICG